MKLMPIVAKIVVKGELKETSNGGHFSKNMIVVDEKNYWITLYNSEAKKIEKDAVAGSLVFIEAWDLKIKEIEKRIFVDFNVNKIKVLK